jgi:DNA-binding MarR family transcriptional regulator
MAVLRPLHPLAKSRLCEIQAPRDLADALAAAADERDRLGLELVRELPSLPLGHPLLLQRFSLCWDVHGIGSTSEEFTLLLALWERDGRTQLELAQWTGKDKSTVTRLVDGLVGKALVVRRDDEADRRRTRLWLTPAGGARGAGAPAERGAAVVRGLEPGGGADAGGGGAGRLVLGVAGGEVRLPAAIVSEMMSTVARQGMARGALPRESSWDGRGAWLAWPGMKKTLHAFDMAVFAVPSKKRFFVAGWR